MRKLKKVVFYLKKIFYYTTTKMLSQKNYFINPETGTFWLYYLTANDNAYKSIQ